MIFCIKSVTSTLYVKTPVLSMLSLTDAKLKSGGENRFPETGDVISSDIVTLLSEAFVKVSVTELSVGPLKFAGL